MKPMENDGEAFTELRKHWIESRKEVGGRKRMAICGLRTLFFGRRCHEQERNH